MLRACVMDFGGSWDTYLPLADFSYNNNHHSSVGMLSVRFYMGGGVELPSIGER